MRSCYKNNLQLLLLISLMVVGTFSSNAPVAPNSDGSCPSNRTIAKVGSSADSLTDKCVLKTKIVFDCQYYSDDDSTSCTCDSSKNADILAVSLDTRRACVPVLNQAVNCPAYTRLRAHNYVCSKCPTQAPFLVTVSTQIEDSNSIPKACSKHRFPNCDVYKVYTNTFQIGSDPTGGYVIGCKSCQSGFTGFATDNAAGFTYLEATDNGVACPKDGSYECTAMVFIDNKYVCDCDTDELVKFRTVSGSQQIEQGCLATTADLYDANCGVYTYDADADLVACYSCSTGYYLLENVVGPAEDDLFSYCFAYEIEGCSTYATTGASRTAAAALADVWCVDCGMGYTLIQTTTDTINGDSDIVLGYCGANSRWIIEEDICLNYAKPNFNTDLYLVCSQCQGDAGDAVPCYVDSSARAGGCTGGALSAIQFGNTAAEICIVTGIIDNCKVYTSFDSNTNTATGCSQCKSGFSLVNTTSTTTTQFCIPNAAIVQKCAVYNNKDFTCAFCNSGLPYDVRNGRCRTADEAGAQCSRAVQVGNQFICIACPQGYTVLNNKCVVGVPKCSSFDVNGVCTACIAGYKLINKNCVEVPANCAIVSQNGDCSSCKAGFELNSNKRCQVSTRNTCYAGLVPLNGQCVPVQQPIRGCVTYTIDSKCDECIEGYVPSSGKNECVRITSSQNPNLKPCPPNTSRIVYKRNPSDPFGDCVAVDVNCANPRDDGHCIECKPGEFAHSDGLCYKIVYSN